MAQLIISISNTTLIEPVQLDDEQVNALLFAIDVCKDHYLDTERPISYSKAELVADQLVDDNELGPQGVQVAWDILIDQRHFFISAQDDYNDGADRAPNLRTLSAIIDANASVLRPSYDDWSGLLEEILTTGVAP